MGNGFDERKMPSARRRGRVDLACQPVNSPLASLLPSAAVNVEERCALRPAPGLNFT